MTRYPVSARAESLTEMNITRAVRDATHPARLIPALRTIARACTHAAARYPWLSETRRQVRGCSHSQVSAPRYRAAVGQALTRLGDAAEAAGFRARDWESWLYSLRYDRHTPHGRIAL